MLRVTGGSLRGFKIDVPKVGAVRPPLEMLREAVFNILGQDLEGCRVADLFAGSGIMGIEALSRGARIAFFVDKNRVATAVIMRNLEKTRALDRARVVTGSAFAAARLLRARGPVDIVFVDPPFDMIRSGESRRKIGGLVAGLFLSGELAGDATVILRIPSKASFGEAPDGTTVVDDRSYGHSRVLFFEAAAAAPGDADVAEADDKLLADAPADAEPHSEPAKQEPVDAGAADERPARGS